MRLKFTILVKQFQPSICYQNMPANISKQKSSFCFKRYAKIHNLNKMFSQTICSRKSFHSLLLIWAHSGTQVGYVLHAEKARIVENKNAVNIFFGITLSQIKLYFIVKACNLSFTFKTRNKLVKFSILYSEFGKVSHF